MKNVLFKQKYRLSQYEVFIWRMPITVSSIFAQKAFLIFKNYVPGTSSIEKITKILL